MSISLPFNGEPVAISGKNKVQSFTFDTLPTHTIISYCNGFEQKIGCKAILVDDEKTAKENIRKYDYGTALYFRDSHRYWFYIRHFPRCLSEMPNGFVNVHLSYSPPKPFGAKKMQYMKYGVCLG